MRKKSIMKALKSYDKLIKEHRKKIEMEKKKQNPNIEVIDYWEKEIRGLENNRIKLSQNL